MARADEEIADRLRRAYAEVAEARREASEAGLVVFVSMKVVPATAPQPVVQYALLVGRGEIEFEIDDFEWRLHAIGSSRSDDQG